MPVFHSTKFKSLRVADLGLRFKDGVLEVEEGPQAERLRGLSAFGVTEFAEAAEPVDAPEPVPVNSDGAVDAVTGKSVEPEAKRATAKRRSRTS